MTGYPGNKEKWIVPSGYSIVYDLFMGGGGWTRAALRSNPKAAVYGAECNPIQRAILMGGWQVEQGLARAADIAGLLKAHIDPSWDGNGCYGDLYPERRAALGQDWWTHVKVPFDHAYYSNQVTVPAIASQILCLTYGYGSNVRISGNGLNTPPNAQKLRSGLPTLPPKVTVRQIYGDFREVQIQPSSLVLIDPPYWLPQRMQRTHQRLTPCYPGHKPYGDDTLQLYSEAVRLAISANAATVVVAGYWSVELYSLLCAISPGYSVECVHHGVLAQQGHKHRYKHGKRSAKDWLPKPVEYEWVLSSVNAPAQAKVEQLCLFA